MCNTFITSQKLKDMQTFMPATARRGYLLCHLIMAKRDNASHRVIMMVAVCSKCEESEHRDKCDHVTAKVLKILIHTAR
jgi:hypothetical protein